MTAPAFSLEPADPFVAVRVVNKMRGAGFTLALKAKPRSRAAALAPAGFDDVERWRKEK